MKQLKVLWILGILLIACASTSSASIIFLGAGNESGAQWLMQGVQTNPNTMHGCLGRNTATGTDVFGQQFAAGSCNPGNPQGTFTGNTLRVGDLGLTGNEDLFIYLVIEGTNSAYKIDDLVLAFFPPDGTVNGTVVTETLDAAYEGLTLGGAGTYAFKLSSPSAQTLAALSDPDVRIGARLKLGNAKQSSASLYLNVVQVQTTNEPSPVPEPSTMALSAVGLIAAGLIGRSRMKR